MGKLVVIFTFLVITVSVFGQKHDNNWLLGGTCGLPSMERGVAILNFDEPSLVPELDPSIVMFFMSITNSSMSHKDGNLLFYTNGNDILNWKHGVVENGGNLIDEGDCERQTLQQGAISLPRPGHIDQYILLTINENFFLLNEEAAVFQKVYYNLVDMTKNNGEGELVIRQDLIVEDTLNIGQGMVCQHANGRDWWLLMFEFDSNEYYRFLIDPAGVQSKGKGYVDVPVIAGRNQAAYSPDGSYLAHFNSTGVNTGTYVDIFNFDRCKGFLSNQVQLNFNDEIPGGGGGLAFSPNSRFLYVPNDLRVYQYDLWAENIESSRLIVAEYDGFIENDFWTSNFHMAQLAPNDKIYITTPTDGHYLHVIHNPNEKGLACNLEQHALEWPTWKHISIPNFPHYRMGALEGSLCDTLGIVNIPIANFIIEELDSSLSYQFQDLSGEVPTEWNWDFGDSNTSSLQNPTHKYDQFGSYNICLTVSNSAGSNTFCEEICVLPEPNTINYISASSLILDCSTENQEIGLSTNFQDLNFANAENWITNWKGPNSFIAEGATQVSVDQGGTYYLSLVDATSSCFISDSIEIIEVDLTLDFSLSQDSITLQCNELVDIELLVNTTCFEVRWERSDGESFSTFNQTSFSFAKAGIYTFFVSDCDNACEAESTLVIEIEPTSALWDSEITGRIVSFTPAVTDPFYFHIWYFGDNNISLEENPIHTYESTGTYEVTHEIIDECDSYEYTKEIIIDQDLVDLPFANFSINLIGDNFDFQFDDLSTGVLDGWSWDFGDSNMSMLQNPTHNYAQFGSYQVCLIASNQIGSDTFCQNICVYPDPADESYISSSDLELTCEIDELILSSQIGGASIEAYPNWQVAWSLGDSLIQTAEDFILVTNAGTYEMNLLDTIYGCNIVETIDIIENINVPNFSLSQSADSIPCGGSFEIYLDVDTSCVEAFIYDEDLNIVSSIEDTVTLSNAGFYFVEVLDCESDCGSTQSITIENELITAAWTTEALSGTIDFMSSQTSNVNHEWFFGDGNISQEQDPTNIYSKSGTYDVIHIVSNACGSDTLQQSVQVIISSSQSLALERVKIFPNPTKDVLHISSLGRSLQRVSLYTSLGQEVMTRSINGSDYTFSTKEFHAGIYLLEVQLSDGVVLVEKIVVTK